MFDWLRPRRSYHFFFYSLLALWVIFGFGPLISRCFDPWISLRCVGLQPVRYFVIPFGGVVLCYLLAAALVRTLSIERWADYSSLLHRLVHPTNGELVALAVIATLYFSVVFVNHLPVDSTPRWLSSLIYESQFFFMSPLVFPFVWYNIHNPDLFSISIAWVFLHFPFIGLWHFLLAMFIAAIPRWLMNKERGTRERLD